MFCVVWNGSFVNRYQCFKTMCHLHCEDSYSEDGGRRLL